MKKIIKILLLLILTIGLVISLFYLLGNYRSDTLDKLFLNYSEGALGYCVEEFENSEDYVTANCLPNFLPDSEFGYFAIDTFSDGKIAVLHRSSIHIYENKSLVKEIKLVRPKWFDYFDMAIDNDIMYVLSGDDAFSLNRNEIQYIDSEFNIVNTYTWNANNCFGTELVIDATGNPIIFGSKSYGQNETYELKLCAVEFDSEKPVFNNEWKVTNLRSIHDIVKVENNYLVVGDGPYGVEWAIVDTNNDIRNYPVYFGGYIKIMSIQHLKNGKIQISGSQDFGADGWSGQKTNLFNFTLEKDGSMNMLLKIELYIRNIFDGINDHLRTVNFA